MNDWMNVENMDENEWMDVCMNAWMKQFCMFCLLTQTERDLSHAGI